MEVLIPLDIPDGEICKYENGEVCVLFCWGGEDFPSCRGWGGRQKIKSFYKHQICLTFCHHTKKDQKR